MAQVNQTFLVVVKLTLAGAPVIGLTTASFGTGDIRLRYVDKDALSPAVTILSPTTHYTVEELFAAGQGIYAFKFVDSLLTQEGPYAITFNKAGVFEDAEGAIEAELATSDDELRWLAGENTVTIVAGYDTNGQATRAFVYGFDSSTDAELFADNPSTYSHLVRFTLEEVYTYDVATGRLTNLVRKRVS